MSLFDDASLVMIPSAYKDGKLYSIKPTDGSGDFTFSRGSNLAATRVNSSGLIEKGRENLLLHSNSFDTTWVLGGATITSGQADKDGGTDAWALTSTTTNGAHRVLQTFTGAANNVVTFSVFAKANGYNFLRIVENAATGDFATFDLSDGSVENNTAISNTAKIESVSGADGWYRCSVAVDCGANTRFDIFLMATSAGGLEFLGDGVSGAYIMNAQVEQGLVATDYIETTTTTAQAGILEDMPRLDYSGGASCPSLLLEPQRTNLALYSEQFDNAAWAKSNATVTANATTSPEGYVNAYKLITNNAVINGQITDNISKSASQITYTSSIFVKKAEWDRIGLYISDASTFNNRGQAFFNLDGTLGTVAAAGTFTNASSNIEEYPNDWYRVYLTVTVPSTTTTIVLRYYSLDNNELNGDGTSGIYIYGAQLEEGRYATSYIPTYNTSVTRSGDAYTNSSIEASLSNGYTAFVECETLSTSEYNQIQFKGSGGNYLLRIGNQVRVLSSSYVANNTSGVNKFALQVESTGNFNLFKNGSSIATGSGVTFDLIEIKNDVSGSNVKQWLVFPTALTDSECIALTS
jgi:hypothetical protein